MIRLPMFNYSQTYIDHGYFEIKIPAKSHDDKRVNKNKYIFNIILCLLYDNFA